MGNATDDRIVRIDMTDQSASIEPLPEAWRLLGGRALSARILLEECDATCDPLGPDNVVLVREPMSQVSNLYLTRMSQVMGMTASKTLRSNQLLALGDVAPPAIIRKGDIVEVIMSRGRVKVTTRAIANEDAPLEGRIRLTNLKSRAPIVGVVHGPGIVVVN